MSSIFIISNVQCFCYSCMNMLCSLATIQYKLNFHIDVNDVYRQGLHQRSFQNFPNNKNTFISLINEPLIHKAVSTFEKLPGHV